MKKGIIFLVITLLTVTTGWVILSSYIHGKDTSDYGQIQKTHAKNEGSPDTVLEKISTLNSTDNFPYTLIAENIRLTDYTKQKELMDYLEKADSSNDNNFQERVFTALSDSLLAVYQKTLNFEDLNTLTSLTNDVTGLHYYALADTKNKIVYEALLDYWMQFINQRLESAANKNYWNKYSFEYKYISAVCQQFNYNPSTGLNTAEKVLSTFADNRYGYLFNRWMLRTSFLQKTGLFVVLSTIIFSLLFTIYRLIKSPKS